MPTLRFQAHATNAQGQPAILICGKSLPALPAQTFRIYADNRRIKTLYLTVLGEQGSTQHGLSLVGFPTALGPPQNQPCLARERYEQWIRDLTL